MINLSPNMIYRTRFSGYAACPLKSVYLESEGRPNSLAIAREINDILQPESVSIYLQTGHHVFNVSENDPEIHQKYLSYLHHNPRETRWSQDNKIFINHSGKEEILIPATLGFIPFNEITNCVEGFVQKYATQRFGEILAKLLHIPFRRMESYLEGGNIYIGKKSDGIPYLLIGQDSIRITARHLAKSKHEFEAKPDFYVQKAIQAISKDLKIPHQNIYPISQPDFHIDMALRPLNYPNVLVSDPRLSLDLLDKLLISGNLNGNQREQLHNLKDDTEKLISSNASLYHSIDRIINELKGYGFNPIVIPGQFGYRKRDNIKANYVNALVHQRKDGKLIYITGASTLPFLDAAFKKLLLSKCPKIASCHFITGDIYHQKGKKETTYIQNSFSHGGGVHCLCTECPDPTWF